MAIPNIVSDLFFNHEPAISAFNVGEGMINEASAFVEMLEYLGVNVNFTLCRDFLDRV
jgi:hypothetical protein